MPRLNARSARHEDRAVVSSHQRRTQRNLQNTAVSLIRTEGTLASPMEQTRKLKSRIRRLEESTVSGSRATRLRARQDKKPTPAKQQPSEEGNGVSDRTSGRLPTSTMRGKQHQKSDSASKPTDIDGTRLFASQHLAGFTGEGQDNTASPVVGTSTSRKARRAAASRTITPAQVTEEILQGEHVSSDENPEATQPHERETPLPSSDVLSQYDLLGHTHDIIRASRSARKSIRVAKAERSKITQPDMKILVKRCKTCTSRFSNLKRHSTEPNPEFLEEVVNILSHVRSIYERRSDRDASTERGLYRSDLHLHLIPQLVILLRQVVLHYFTCGDDLNAGLRISIEQLRLVSALTLAIVQVAGFAKNLKKTQPGLPRGIITSTHSEIAKPLRAANEAFMTHLQRHSDEIRQHAQNADIKEGSRHHSAVKEHLHKWRRLHEERRYAEGSYLTAEKQRHLAYFDPRTLELDSDGLTFERVHLFGSARPQIGPSVAQLQRAREGTNGWSPDQLVALRRGLKNFTGPNVFRNIFQMYCGRNGLLNKFNVAEIVTRAADLKHSLLNDCRKSDTPAPEWIQQIPVWTRPIAPGKENEMQAER